LQVTTDPNFVFPVYEKVALRIKGEHAIGLLAPAAPPPPPPPPSPGPGGAAGTGGAGRGGRPHR
jgi:hypothetical protein